MDAFLGSLPGHGVENVRRPLINTMNLADLLPTSTIWTGLANAPCPMYPPLCAGAHALRHARRDAFPAQPACARPGAHLHVRPDWCRQVNAPGPYRRAASALSRACRSSPLTRACRCTRWPPDSGRSRGSGLHFTVAADDDQLAFCPLQFLETKGDRAWAMEWIDTILALNGVEHHTGPAQRNWQRDPEHARQRRAYALGVLA